MSWVRAPLVTPKVPSGLITIIKVYRELKQILDNLSDKTTIDLVNILFPDSNEELSDLRAIAQTLLETANEPLGLLKGLIKTITQPDIPTNPDFVRVMSLHKSKGLTSKIVYIAGMVEGILPKYGLSNDEIEESRRLFYVGEDLEENIEF